MILTRDISNEWRGRGLNLAIISIAFWLAALLLVNIRVYYRICHRRGTSLLATLKSSKGKLGLDDVAIVCSLFFSLALSIANCISVKNGIGKPAKTLSKQHLYRTLQTFWAAQIAYKFTINTTKISICLLYLRVFYVHRWLRHTVYWVMGYVLLYALGSIIATIFECIPIGRIWEKTVPGTCIDITAFWYCNAAANIIGDVIIFFLPWKLVHPLQMPKAQKWGLRLIFTLGLFVCITSILRMTTLKTGSKAHDQTFGTLNSTIWTTIEANTGIICACLPMLKIPLARLFPKMLPRSSGRHQSYDSAYGSGGRSGRRGGSFSVGEKGFEPGSKHASLHSQPLRWDDTRKHSASAYRSNVPPTPMVDEDVKELNLSSTPFSIPSNNNSNATVALPIANDLNPHSDPDRKSKPTTFSSSGIPLEYLNKGIPKVSCKHDNRWDACEEDAEGFPSLPPKAYNPQRQNLRP